MGTPGNFGGFNAGGTPKFPVAEWILGIPGIVGAFPGYFFY